MDGDAGQKTHICAGSTLSWGAEGALGASFKIASKDIAIVRKSKSSTNISAIQLILIKCHQIDKYSWDSIDFE